jgi:hypothetical protein
MPAGPVADGSQDRTFLFNTNSQPFKEGLNKLDRDISGGRQAFRQGLNRLRKDSFGRREFEKTSI